MQTKRRGEKALKPVRPNIGIEIEFRRRLTKLIDEMSRSVDYWLTAAYRSETPKVAELAEDELSSAALRAAIRKLVKRWNDNFDDAAEKLAKYFSQSIAKRSDAVLKKILKDGGFTVEFKMTAAMRDVMNATISEQVALIKSIPQQYLTQVEGIVMRGVQAGRDAGSISKGLQEQLGVTKRRAAFIAQDQSNKATASMTRVRHLEIGITEAVWMHSGGGKEPRPTHVAMNGKKYDIAKGMWDSAVGQFIMPGELPRCRCVSGAVVKGFS